MLFSVLKHFRQINMDIGTKWVYPFVYNVEKRLNLFKNFLKYIWPFFNIIHERVNEQSTNAFVRPKSLVSHKLSDYVSAEEFS